jgi:membrane glycosyltransferase
MIPEESNPPDIVIRADRLHADLAPSASGGGALQLLLADDVLCNLHRAALEERRRRRGEVDVDLVVALAKLEEASTLTDALQVLSPPEKMALLSNRRGFDALMERANAKGDDVAEGASHTNRPTQ